MVYTCGEMCHYELPTGRSNWLRARFQAYRRVMAIMKTLLNAIKAGGRTNQDTEKDLLSREVEEGEGPSVR